MTTPDKKSGIKNGKDYYNNFDLAEERRRTSPFNNANNHHPDYLDLPFQFEENEGEFQLEIPENNDKNQSIIQKQSSLNNLINQFSQASLAQSTQNQNGIQSLSHNLSSNEQLRTDQKHPVKIHERDTFSKSPHHGFLQTNGNQDGSQFYEEAFDRTATLNNHKYRSKESYESQSHQQSNSFILQGNQQNNLQTIMEDSHQQINVQNVDSRDHSRKLSYTNQNEHNSHFTHQQQDDQNKSEMFSDNAKTLTSDFAMMYLQPIGKQSSGTLQNNTIQQIDYEQMRSQHTGKSQNTQHLSQQYLRANQSQPFINMSDNSYTRLLSLKNGQIASNSLNTGNNNSLSQMQLRQNLVNSNQQTLQMTENNNQINTSQVRMQRHNNLNFIPQDTNMSSFTDEDFLTSLSNQKLTTEGILKNRNYGNEIEQDEDLQFLRNQTNDVNSSQFIENLQILYKRRIQNAYGLVESLSHHKIQIQNWSRYLQDLQSQLQQNTLQAENEIRLKKQQLLLEIEKLYESAMRDIDLQSKLKGDQIVDKMQQIQDHQNQVEQTIDMIKLRIKGQSQQKFVLNYLNTIKEGEAVLSKNVKIDGQFEQMVTELKIKAPFFNYFISQKNHKGELVTLSMNLIRNGSRDRTNITMSNNDTRFGQQRRQSNQTREISGRRLDNTNTNQNQSFSYLKPDQGISKLEDDYYKLKNYSRKDKSSTKHLPPKQPKENISRLSNNDVKQVPIPDISEISYDYSTLNKESLTPNAKSNKKIWQQDSSEKKDNLRNAKQKIFDKIDELEKLINQKPVSKDKTKKSSNRKPKTIRLKSEKNQDNAKPNHLLQVPRLQIPQVNNQMFNIDKQTRHNFQPDRFESQQSHAQKLEYRYALSNMESAESLRNTNKFIQISPLHSEPIEAANSNSRANIGDQTFSPIQLDSMKKLNKIYSSSTFNHESKSYLMNQSDLAQNKIRLYIPFGYPPYSCFYLLQFNPEICTSDLMEYLLQHLQLSSSRIEQQSYYMGYKLNQNDALVELMGAQRPIKTIIDRIVGQQQIYGPNYRSGEKGDGRWPRLYLVDRNDQSNI
eukprot:403337666